MQRHPDYTRDRIRQVGERLRDQIYAQTQVADEILVSQQVDRISLAEAQQLPYRPAKLGEHFGPAWATFWFKVKAVVPPAWAQKRVDLLWVTYNEAALWVNGRSVQGLNMTHGDRPDAILLDKARGGETLEFYVEMACNKKFGQPWQDYHNVSPYLLDRCDIAAFDPLAWEMYYDLFVLQQLEADMGKEHATSDLAVGGYMLYELNRFANALEIEDRGTWGSAHQILKGVYAACQGGKGLNHEVSAIGHAHIDTAWLWPLAETRRKCERTFSSATTYMDYYPEYKFACSQAYQYQVIKQCNPDLYQRIRAKVANGQFIPVGGSWVEPDCNIPCGESLVRQLVLGQRFFEKEFGIRCKEFWQPDVFGYNGQLPQIMHLAGMDRFLTQKLSFNRFNKPHHHTFTWQAIDGTEVLAHFPPADTYNAMGFAMGKAEVEELRYSVRNYKEHDRSRHSIMLFGYGDGGGGPTKHMLEIIRRCGDVQGLPRVRMRSSDEFFTLLEKDCTDRPVIIGELYFELHRGTYTSQAAAKRGNRKNEVLLHDLEFLATAASMAGAKYHYPADQLQKLWETLCLNQFHDILPGSSIAMVYEDTARDHARIAEEGGALRSAAAQALLGGKGSGAVIPINTIGFARAEVAQLPDGTLAYVTAPSYGIGVLAEAGDSVSLIEEQGRVILENAHLRAELGRDGRLLGLVEKHTNRQALTGPGNVYQLFDDLPTAAAAWDVDPFHLESVQDCPPAKSCEVTSRSPLRAQVTFEHAIGRKSSLKQVVRLDAGSRRLEFHCDVEWEELHKFLKVAFPMNARAMNATYEMQFGCVERPTHYNTPYDLARFEVPGHKWADLSEYGFGVSLLSESKYGYSTFGNMMRLSLLRAPTSPDKEADVHQHHHFAYAILPHAGDWRQGQTVAEAYRFNVPLVFADAGRPVPARSFAAVDDANLVLDTIKKAEDSNAVVLRLYECHGGRGTAHLRLDVPVKSAVFCNLLEEETAPARISGGAIEVPYAPFKIISLKVNA